MKQRAVIFSPEAETDILAIYEWIADAASPVTAMRYIERLETYCRGFDLASERGHRRDDIRPGMRIVGFEQSVTIALAVLDDTVTIMRLFYGGQDWESAF